MSKTFVDAVSTVMICYKSTKIWNRRGVGIWRFATRRDSIAVTREAKNLIFVTWNTFVLDRPVTENMTAEKHGRYEDNEAPLGGSDRVPRSAVFWYPGYTGAMMVDVTATFLILYIRCSLVFLILYSVSKVCTQCLLRTLSIVVSTLKKNPWKISSFSSFFKVSSCFSF